jgi:hypothetical protein
MPVVVKADKSDLRQGPVMVTIEYQVIPERKADFVETIHQYERVRRRDGASQWGVFYDAEDGNRYVEVFLVSSWAEHQRQHERQTQADHDLEQRLARYVIGPQQVRHLIFAQAKE